MRGYKVPERTAWWRIGLVIVLVLGLAAPGAVKVVHLVRGEKPPAEATPAPQAPARKVAASADVQPQAPEAAKTAARPAPTAQVPAPKPAAVAPAVAPTPVPPMDPIETACAKYAQALEQVRQEEQKWYDQTAGPRIRYYASAEYQAARAENANSIVKLTGQLEYLRQQAAAAAADPRAYPRVVGERDVYKGRVRTTEPIIAPAEEFYLKAALRCAAERDACAVTLANLAEQERLLRLNQDKELRSYAEEFKRRVFARQVALASVGKHQPTYQYLSKRKAVEDKKGVIETKQGVIAMLEKAGAADKVGAVEAEIEVLKAELKALEGEMEQAAEAIRAQAKQAAPAQPSLPLAGKD